MKKLDIALWRIDNALLMKVLHVDESLVGKMELFSKNEHMLYNDRDICFYEYGNKESCDKMVEFIKEALLYFNGDPELRLGGVYKTRGGEPARCVCVDKKGCYPCICLVGEEERVVTYEKDGTYIYGNGGHPLTIVLDKPEVLSPTVDFERVI